MLQKHFSLVSACILAGLLAGRTQGKPPALAAPHIPAATRPGKSGRITAAIDGLQGSSGYLRVSLYASSTDFPDGVPLARRDIPLQALGTKAFPLTITFSGLRPGAYAVCAFHDRDGSGKLTQSFLGIPEEEWGMSGNPRPQLRVPRFGEARIDLKAQEAKLISITLHL